MINICERPRVEQQDDLSSQNRVNQMLIQVLGQMSHKLDNLTAVVHFLM